MERYKILNGFAEQYTIDENGKVYDGDLELKADHRHEYRLLYKGGEDIKPHKVAVTLKKLYRLVFDREYSEDDIIDLPNEQWRYIDGTNKVYMVSNMGRIKSLLKYKAQLLKQNDITGYQRVDIFYNKRRITELVHKLVAAAFLPQPPYGYVIHHINRDRLDNRAENLVYVSIMEHRRIHSKAAKGGTAAESEIKECGGKSTKPTGNIDGKIE